MSISPEPVSRADRWRALGLLLGVIALAYVLLIHPWWTVPMRRLGDELETLRARDARAQALLAQAGQIQAALAQLQGDGTHAPGFMPETSVQLATAALVQRLETVVREASPGHRSCALINRTPLAGASAGRFPRATVQVRLICGNAELGHVLYLLESGRPHLFVDNLNISARRQARDGSNNGGVDASFELYGYLPPSARDGANANAP